MCYVLSMAHVDTGASEIVRDRPRSGEIVCDRPRSPEIVCDRRRDRPRSCVIVRCSQDGDADQCGMIHHTACFGAMRAMEAAGLPTRFPHASHLYDTLLAKDWQVREVTH